MGGKGIRWLPSATSVIVLLLLGAAIWWLRRHDPAQGAAVLACRFNQWTGLQCPGCGITRATHHLLNGRWSTAFYFNAFFVAALPAAALWAAWWFRHWPSNQNLTPRALKTNLWLGGIMLALWLAFGVLRNFPGWPLL